MAKDNPRLLNEDIYKYISDNSSLTKKQVLECFSVYKDMIENIFFSEYIDDNTTVVMPNIGNFKLRKIKGRKKGTVYNMPYVTGGTRKVVLEEDEMDTYRLSFKVSDTLNEKLKKRKREYERNKL